MHTALVRTLLVGMAIAPIAGIVATAPAVAAPTSVSTVAGPRTAAAGDIPTDSPTPTYSVTGFNEPTEDPSDPGDSVDPGDIGDPSDPSDPGDPGDPGDPTPGDTETGPVLAPVETVFTLRSLTKRIALGQVVTLAGLLVTDPESVDEFAEPTGAVPEPVSGAHVQLCTQSKVGRGWGAETCGTASTTGANGVATWAITLTGPIRVRAVSAGTDTVLGAASNAMKLEAKAPKIFGKGRHHGSSREIVLTVDPGAKTLVNIQLKVRGTWRTVRTQSTDAKGRVTVGSLKKGTYRILAAGSTTGPLVGL